MSDERYRAVEGSRLGHGCCFDATVVDTRDDSVICECFSTDEATLVADALNCFSLTQVLPKAKKPL